jgi:hypothetical protein
MLGRVMELDAAHKILCCFITERLNQRFFKMGVKVIKDNMNASSFMVTFEMNNTFNLMGKICLGAPFGNFRGAKSGFRLNRNKNICGTITFVFVVSFARFSSFCCYSLSVTVTGSGTLI